MEDLAGRAGMDAASAVKTEQRGVVESPRTATSTCAVEQFGRYAGRGGRGGSCRTCRRARRAARGPGRRRRRAARTPRPHAAPARSRGRRSCGRWARVAALAGCPEAPPPPRAAGGPGRASKRNGIALIGRPSSPGLRSGDAGSNSLGHRPVEKASATTPSEVVEASRLAAWAATRGSRRATAE